MSKAQIYVRAPGEGDTLAVTGDLYRILAEGSSTGGRCFFCHATVPPGSGSPPHVHHHDAEAFYVLKGQMTFHNLETGSRTVAGPGSFAYLPEAIPHRFGNEGEEPVEMLIWASSPALGEMFRAVGRPSQTPSPPTAEEIALLISRAPEFGIALLPQDAADRV